MQNLTPCVLSVIFSMEKDHHSLLPRKIPSWHEMETIPYAYKSKDSFK